MEQLRRTIAVLLALSMFVPMIESAAAQPEDPEPPDEPPEPPEEAPEEPPEEVPDPPEEAPEVPEEPPDEPPEEPPEPPSPQDATTSPRATYFEQDFGNISDLARVELSGDRVGEPIWHVEPVGYNDSDAAVLSTSKGLPRGLHQGLATAPIDLTPVPSVAEDPTAASLTEAGVKRASGDAQQAFRTAAAMTVQEVAERLGVEDWSDLQSTRLSENSLFKTGPISIPQGPASLTLFHSFRFDDTRNEEGDAVSGFTIEARSEDGDWVPVEAAALAQPLHGADAPGPRKQADDAGQLIPDQGSPCDAESLAQEALDDVVAELFLVPGNEFDEDQIPLPVGCEEGSVSADVVPGTNELVLSVGDATFQVSTGPANNDTDPEEDQQGAPVMPNAHIEPLDQRGFTGTSDSDDDGDPDVIGHTFDLSPWAGKEVELRLRAGTSAVTEVPAGFWALDHAVVRAPARTADLRVDLTAPSEDHMAPQTRSGEGAFPVRAEIQNVGSTTQQGPFEVEFTFQQRGGSSFTATAESAPGAIGFLESTTVQHNLTILGSEPYLVDAELVSPHPDQDPRNDEDADVLPVGIDPSVDIDVRPEASVVKAGELVSTTVVLEPDSNVRINDTLELSAFPYDPATQLPIGDGEEVLGEQRVHLPRAASKHPAGVEDAVESVEFTRALPEGAYLLVAELGESTARAPLGVGSPPPPLLSEDFSSIDEGPESFSLETRSGEWTARPDSDVTSVPHRIDPGTADTGSAWIPLEHDATLVHPQGHESITSRGLVLPDVCGLVNQGDNENCPDGVGTPLLLKSPRGTQRVHAMATEVPLYDASQAQLEFLSSLIPPKDASGVSEARVYVATDQDMQSLMEPLTNPENCQPINQAREDAGLGVSEELRQVDETVEAASLSLARALAENPCVVNNWVHVDQAAEFAVQSVFNLDEELRCGIPEVVNENIGDEDTRTGLKDITCPEDTPQRDSEPGNCLGGTQGGTFDNFDEAPCHVDELSQLSALVPMLGGTLVHRETTPHTWERQTVDLDPWAGENVTIGIVYIGESHETTLTYDVSAAQPLAIDPLSGTIGYEPPGRSQGSYLASRVQVTSDEGVKLEPEDARRIENNLVNSAQTFRPGEARPSWETVGYDHFTGLGDRETPLRTSAQLLTGRGNPIALGADAGDGLRLGVERITETGVELFPRGIQEFSTTGRIDRSPGSLPTPVGDPAVTVLSSPELDLSGTEDPVLRFRQKFDLTTEHGPQETTQRLLPEDLAGVFGLPSNVTSEEECRVGLHNERASKFKPTLEALVCLLEEKRNREDSFDVQNEIVRSDVAEPRVSAGLFVQARTVTEDGLSEPRLVQPVDGYRYPIEDSGGFEPTLDYTVESPDSYPAYTTGQRGLAGQDNIAHNQPTYRDQSSSLFDGTPVWAGDSDRDRDGQADWITSQLDLSPFAGEQVRLEFVLVARHDQEDLSPTDDATLLSEEPWSIDDIEVTESNVDGEVAIEELRWPSTDLPFLMPENDVPVRLTVTTPTGLDKPIHAKSVLVDDRGCVLGTDTVQAQFENEAGRVEPMPAGATLELPDMIIDGEDVTADATPWNLLVGVDVGQEPSVLAPASVHLKTNLHRLSTGGYDVSSGTDFKMNVQTPDCERDGDLLTDVDILSVVPAGGHLDIERDDEDDRELQFTVETADDVDKREFGDRCKEDRLTGDAPNTSFEECVPVLLAVSQGDGSDAGGRSLLLSSDETTEERTAEIETPSQRLPVGSPFQVTLDVQRDLDDATLWSVDPTDPTPTADRVWPQSISDQGSVSAGEDRELVLTLDEPGPKLLVLSGESQGHDAPTLAGTLVVGTNAERAGDPTIVDNRAQLQAKASEHKELTVQRVDVTPSTGLSTTPRTIETDVQNTGTTTLHDLEVTFRAKGDAIATKTRDVLRAGEMATFTLPDFNTGSTPSLAVQVHATAEDDASGETVRHSGAAPVRSLVELGSLTPVPTDDSEGWQLDGATAAFQDPETGLAPRDTSGSVDLVREAHRAEEGARLEGLGGVAVELDHELDMEERFDGGQVVLTDDTGTTPLTLGEASKEMGPYSPIGGDALTGVRQESNDEVQLDTSDVDTEKLLEEDAADAVGFPLLADSPDEDPDGSGYADCHARTFADDRLDVELGQPYCEHVDPILPAPSTAASDGIWYFQPASFLSDRDEWTVKGPGTDYELKVMETTSFVFLEAGEDLVTAAQEEDKLEIHFEEARLLDPIGDEDHRPLSVEVCARFMHLSEDGAGDPQRRCTSLNHEDSDEQVAEKPWSSQSLTINDIPEAQDEDNRYNAVRLELSLKEDRRSRTGTGLVGDKETTSDGKVLRDDVKGWFVGPITAKAGNTDETWKPDQDAMAEVDPNLGVDADNLEQFLQDNDITSITAWQNRDWIIEQSSTFALTDVLLRGGGEIHSGLKTVQNIQSNERMKIKVPFTSCAWEDADACGGDQLLDVYYDDSKPWAKNPNPLTTAPFALELMCNKGPVANGNPFTVKPASVDGECQEMPGMGVQALDKGTFDDDASGPCDDHKEGPPMLWRTRCLFAERAQDVEDGGVSSDSGGSSLVFGTTDDSLGDPVRSRGHSLDYRLAVPVDLRFAADGADLWARANLEEVGESGSQGDLSTYVRAEARIQGEDTWRPVPYCERAKKDECNTGRRTVGGPLMGAPLDLSGFVGQQIELALRFEHPHPTIEGDDADRERIAFHDITVEAGYARFVNTDMQLRAWTDPSIEGQGWNVEDVKLFGLPIEANAGIDEELESKLLVEHEDADEEKLTDQLHVHADTRTDDELFLSVPVNLTLFNQGVDAESLGLEASLQARNGSGQDWVYSTAEDWTSESDINAPGECEVSIEPIEPDEVDMAPGQSEKVFARVSFLPDGDEADPDDADQETLAHCFPGQFEDDPDDDEDRERQVSELVFRLHVNVTDVPEDDYVASDDSLTQRLRPNPFLEYDSTELGGELGELEPELAITAFDVEPTRPGPEDSVRVSANVSLIDHTSRGADIELLFVDPGSDEVLASFSGTDADTPITTFKPYQRTSLNWTFSEVPDSEVLVRLAAEITREGETARDEAHAWLAPGSVEDQTLWYPTFGGLSQHGDARLGFQGGESYYTTRGTTDQGQGFSLFLTISGDESTNQELEAGVSTPWFQLEDSPPPLIGVQARWSFDGTDRDGNSGHQVADGWAIQVCHVPGEPSSGDCDPDTNSQGSSGAGDWAWRTVDVLQTPGDTLAEVADPSDFAQPGGCEGASNLDPQSRLAQLGTTRGASQEGDNTTCSAVTAQWANLHKGEDIITNTSAGFNHDIGDEGAFSTVLASLPDCSIEHEDSAADCPDWESGDRHHNIRVRIVAVGASDTDRNLLTVSDVTLSPVGISGEPRQSTAGFPIPEEATKAVPMSLETQGEIGTKIEARVDEPAGWNVDLEGLPETGAVEEDSQPRLMVEAPISSSGISQSATLTPRIDVPVEPRRGIETVVPIGVQAGQHPDLVVEDVQLSGDVKKNDEALVQVRVKNDGFRTSEKTEITGLARYDDGRVNLLEPPQGQDAVILDELPPGVEETVVLRWTPSAAGNATVRVAADLDRAEPLSGPVVTGWGGGKVAELTECDADECNNLGTERVDVIPPREADTSVDIEVLGETPLVVGEPVEVRVEVRNAGPATVPAFEVRLLAGVVSLLEDDPLRVTEPLAPGESWSTTVELIPGFGGELDLVGQARADESLVRELRGLKPGGGTYDEDNVHDRRVPVVARGLNVEIPRIVRGDDIATNGSLEVPVSLENLGNEALDVSAAAEAEDAIGTLVDAQRQPIGTVALDPGEAENATLLLLYEGLPDAGRQPVTVDAASKAGIERRGMDVEVPSITDLSVRPVVRTADAGQVQLPVTVDVTGNTPVEAQIAVNAPGLSQATRTVELEPGTTSTVELESWLSAPGDDPVTGQIVVRADTFTERAPLRIVPEGDVMPTIEDAVAVGGSQPHTRVSVANLGVTGGTFEISLLQQGERLATETVALRGEASENVTLEALAEPGPATVNLAVLETGAQVNWTMDVPDLKPNVRVLHTRLDPASPEPGDEVDVQATIANDGGSAVDIRPGLFVDGILHTVSSQERTIQPGEVASVTFKWTAEDGDHTLSVSADPQDRIEDESKSDDAIGQEVRIQADTAAGPSNVPFVDALLVVSLLACLALLRRDADE